jgi:hypothetical protein
VWIMYGNQVHLQGITTIQTFGNISQRTTSRHSVQLYLMPGLKKSIRMRIVGMYPGIFFCNEKRKRLVKTFLLLLDESVSGWQPNTTKLGGLPNYTHES